MKNNNFLLFCWLLAVPLLWGGCGKEGNCPERKLPPITTEGRNTIGFKLDGEVWTPHVNASVIQTPLDFGKLTVVYNPNTDFFYIRADRRPDGKCDTSNQVFHIGLSIDRDFPADSSALGNNGAQLSDWSGGNKWFRFDTTASYSLAVHRFDLDQRVLSCSFECGIIHRGTGTRREITEGRLDVTF
jgi:hypothetical protein